MEVRSASVEDVFQVYTCLEKDVKIYVLDVRPLKDFKRKHLLQSYSIRLSANGRALLDYSKNEYHFPWSADCWWDRHVLVYGDASDNKASRHHPVVAFLAQDNHAKSLSVFKPGLGLLEDALPFLCTASIKANAHKRFPAAIIPRLLYLGGWDSAEDTERLQELNVTRLITIHNHPDNLKPPAGFKHLKFTLADIDTADIAPAFGPTFDFIEGARSSNQAVLVHCGAGASRSAALCMAYLMRAQGLSAEQARAHCRARRSVVLPNDGFWRALCALERQLGLHARSDPEAMRGVHGTDAAVPIEVPDHSERQRVAVSFLPAQVAATNQARDQAGDTSPRDEAARLQKRRRLGEGDALPGEKKSEDDGNADVARDRHRHRHRDSKRASERHGQQDREDRRRDWEGHRGRDGDGDRDRDRGRQRDSGRQQHADRDPGQPRDGNRESGRQRDRSGRDTREHRPQHEPEETAMPPAASVPSIASDRGTGEVSTSTKEGVVLEVSREGKALGKLVLALQETGQRCIIGRDTTPGACDMVLEHASVSRKHAHLVAGPAGSLTLIDLGSAHGTNVDGLWLRPNVPRQLKMGSILRFGGSTRSYEVKALPSA